MQNFLVESDSMNFNFLWLKVMRTPLTHYQSIIRYVLNFNFELEVIFFEGFESFQLMNSPYYYDYEIILLFIYRARACR
jgi:hypothetical protein